MQSLIKPLPIVITIVTMFGVLMHDTHVDKLATIAVVPASFAATGALEKSITPNYHTHVERVSLPKITTSFRSTLPNMQPPRDDDRKYIQNKKLMYVGGGDTASLWPSV